MALHLPVLEGRSFLDVGCNEGFFCGFAKFAGAARSVGLDRSREFIERARRRFPDCEFHCQNWDYLPDGPFDVILLASALHYADDQATLLHRLVDHLAPDGVLVLELGIVPSQKSEWVKVTRGIDERWFPSLMKLREILTPYASKWMGPSVHQAGDPVERHVVHVSHRRPVGYLLMQPPGHGKSSMASKLFVPAGVPVVSGDRQISRLARGEITAPAKLREAVVPDFSPYSINRVIDRLMEKGLGRDLVALWLAEAGDGDFAIDSYIPKAHHAEVLGYLTDAGYLPVMLDWDRPGLPFMEDLEDKAEAFHRSLRRNGALPAMNDGVAAADPVRGYVDRVQITNNRLVINGWASSPDHQLPAALVVRFKGRIVTCEDFEVVPRPDVREHLGAAHDRLGFRITLEGIAAKRLSDLGREFCVSPMGGRAFRLTAAVAKRLGRK
jgi:SAM-dependent methyltransferase